MPYAAPRVCSCGRVVAAGATCICRRIQRQEADKRRPTARERGYDSQWDRERKAYLQVNPYCRRCNGPASVVDHIIPHRGDKRLFWDRSNWQALCSHCHNAWKQARECRDHE